MKSQNLQHADFFYFNVPLLIASKNELFPSVAICGLLYFELLIRYAAEFWGVRSPKGVAE